MNPQVVILAGGLGTRLGPLTENCPKSMVEVLGKPFLQHQIELLRDEGFNRFLLCVGHHADQIESFLGDGARFGVQVQYSHDGTVPLGTGGALVKALSFVDSWFLVLDGDSYLPIDFRAPIAHFCEARPLAQLTVYRNMNRYVRSNVAIRRGRVTIYDRAKGDYQYVHVGLTIFQRQTLERFPADRFMLMDEIYQSLVATRDLGCFVVRRRFYEMGSFEGMADLERRLTRRQSHRVEAAHP